MPPIRIVAERHVVAPAAVVYGIFANYRDGLHQTVLPPAFSDVEIVGGVGTGTVVLATLTLLGRSSRFQTRLSEPEPGRLLVETIPATGTETRFLVEPAPGGGRVRLVTRQPPSAGPIGWLERLLLPRLLGNVYRDELERLAAFAPTLATNPSPPAAPESDRPTG